MQHGYPVGDVKSSANAVGNDHKGFSQSPLCLQDELLYGLGHRGIETGRGLIDEYDLPPILFTGSDICNQRGPMVSPAFLRQYYFPHVKHAFEPFLDAGIRVVRHCDGNVMPLIDDWIGVGYSGFQGFQYECGVDPYAIAARRSITGERLIFFAGLNVSRTLPFGTIEDVAAEIEYVVDLD